MKNSIWKTGLRAVLMVVVTAVMAVCVSAANEIDSGKCGENLTWVLYDDGLLEISGTGAMDNYDGYNYQAPWHWRQKSAVLLHEGITAIGDYAELGYSNSEGSSLTIPSTVISIGKNAFTGCSYTGDLIIPSNVKTIKDFAFYPCSIYGELILENGVTSIGQGAFLDCSGFKGNLIIPNSVTTIGEGAFSGCSGFTGLTLPTRITTIGDSAFYECKGFTGKLEIPDSVKTIGNSAFSTCIGFTRLTLPAGLTTIGDYAFFSCKFEGTLTIPDSVKTIGNGAFQNCAFFASRLTIPSSVTSIGEYAFYGFGSQSGITGRLILGSGLQSISKYAFSDCYGFTGDLVIPGNVKKIDENAFYNCFNYEGTLTISNGVKEIEYNAFNNCCRFSGALIIPDSVEWIDSNAFFNCYGFTGDLTIPGSVEMIGKEAFSGCRGMTGKLTLSDGVELVGIEAFRNCGFSEAEFSFSVTDIGQGAFSNCDNLNSVYFKGDAPQSIASANHSSPSFMADKVTLYYIDGKSGWTPTKWKGYKTAVWGSGQDQTGKKAIIMVPGVTGTELYGLRDGELIPVWDYDHLVHLAQALKNDLLYCDENGESVYDVRAYDETSSPYGMKDTYKDLMIELRAQFEPEYEVSFFGYDWRLPNNRSADKLNDYIKTHNYKEVILVAHSMGGIVSSLYIKNYDPDMNVVDRLITLGTPYYGSPKVYKTLINGDFLDIDLNWGNAFLKGIARNMTTAYELLPSPHYFDNGYYFIEQYENKWNPFNTNTEKLNYEQSIDLLKQFNTNQKLIEKSKEMVNELSSIYNKLTAENTKSYFIVGYNTNTIATLRPGTFGLLNADQYGVHDLDVNKNGDGTVPLISSTMNGATPKNRTYYVKGISHTDLVQNENTIRLVVNIIKDKAVSDYDKEYSKKIYRGDMADKIKIDKFNGYKVIAACPVDLTVYDKNGNWLGTASSEKIETAEGYEYNFYTCGPDDEIKIAFIDEEADIVIKGYDEGAMDVQIVELEDDVIVDQVQYTDVAVTPDTEFRTDTTMDGEEHLKVIDSEGESVILPDKEVLAGDVNDDGMVDYKDLTILSRYLAGWTGYEEKLVSKTAANLNRDDTIDARDRMILARHLNGVSGYEQISRQ